MGYVICTCMNVCMYGCRRPTTAANEQQEGYNFVNVFELLGKSSSGELVPNCPDVYVKGPMFFKVVVEVSIRAAQSALTFI